MVLSREELKFIFDIFGTITRYDFDWSYFETNTWPKVVKALKYEGKDDRIRELNVVLDEFEGNRNG